jgi:nicotinate-nucleotide adenylyltransferase
MKNVAFYGGSFDPPHLGHVMVVTHLLLNDPGIDAVAVVPCHLQVGKNLSAFSHRLQMCQLAFGHLPRTMVDPVEGTLGGETLTIKTLRHLRETRSDWKLRLVMGADLMHKAPGWEKWDEIVTMAPPLVVGRAGIAPLGPGDPTPLTPVVSSTRVREALRGGHYRDAERYLTRGVLDFIQAHRLYEQPAA